MAGQQVSLMLLLFLRKRLLSIPPGSDPQSPADLVPLESEAMLVAVQFPIKGLGTGEVFPDLFPDG